MEEKVYTIGKGKMLFKAAGEDNFHDCGNAPDFKVATGITKKPHFSSRSGTKTKDKDPIIEQTATGSLTVDDLLSENLRMWLMASAIANIIQTQGTISAQAVVAELDKWIDLGKRKISSVVVKAVTEAWRKATTGAVITISFAAGEGAANDTILDSGSGFITAGFEEGDTIVVDGSTENDGTYVILSVAAGSIGIANGSLTTEAAGDTVTVSRQYNVDDSVLAGTLRAVCTTKGIPGATEPTWAGKAVGDTVTDGDVVWTIAKLTYVLNTDYRLDTEVGHIMPLSAGDIKDAQALKADFSHAAITVRRISAATVSALEGHVWFVGDPPIGKIVDVKGYCSITPKGDLMLVGDDYTSLQFELEFLSGYGYTGLFDLLDRGIVT